MIESREQKKGRRKRKKKNKQEAIVSFLNILEHVHLRYNSEKNSFAYLNNKGF